jgi:hypothetical protein
VSVSRWYRGWGSRCCATTSSCAAANGYTAPQCRRCSRSCASGAPSRGRAGAPLLGLVDREAEQLLIGALGSSPEMIPRRNSSPLALPALAASSVGSCQLTVMVRSAVVAAD